MVSAWTIIARALWRLLSPPWWPKAEYHSIHHLREHGAEARLWQDGYVPPGHPGRGHLLPDDRFAWEEDDDA